MLGGTTRWLTAMAIKLNGWQRLWVVVTGLLLVLTCVVIALLWEHADPSELATLKNPACVSINYRWEGPIGGKRYLLFVLMPDGTTLVADERQLSRPEEAMVTGSGYGPDDFDPAVLPVFHVPRPDPDTVHAIAQLDSSPVVFGPWKRVEVPFGFWPAQSTAQISDSLLRRFALDAHSDVELEKFDPETNWLLRHLASEHRSDEAHSNCVPIWATPDMRTVLLSFHSTIGSGTYHHRFPIEKALRSYRTALLGHNLRTAAIALVVWTLGSAALYGLGWVVGWITRGFRKQA